MKYVVCNVTVAPLRKEPAHRSEMTSQLLRNEIAEVLEAEKQFTKVKCLYDDYEGWVANNQVTPRETSPEEGAGVGTAPFEAAGIKEKALKFLDTPYLWGGKTACGIDCSGFSQQVFKQFGIKLPRDSYQQAEAGEVVGFLVEARCGDLAFFDNEEGRITHVGIMLSNDQIIHSSGKVRIDKIDSQGIINSETGARTHKLRIIKRYKKP
jgi:gamma-D-glutamyl-L-lysine dipeptidyl-peptidase